MGDTSSFVSAMAALLPYLPPPPPQRLQLIRGHANRVLQRVRARRHASSIPSMDVGMLLLLVV